MASSPPSALVAPQLYADVDRTRVEMMNVPLASVFETLQVYLGSIYVNDFNYLGRTYQVRAQAEAGFRGEASDIALLKTRNSFGEMVPLGSVVDVRRTTGPDRVVRYNLYPAAEVNGERRPGRELWRRDRRHGARRGRDATARLRLRVDRPHLPGDPGGRDGLLHLPALRALRVPGRWPRSTRAGPCRSR